MTDPGTGVAVVVVAYGHEDLLTDCLAPLAGRFETVVVDNAGSGACRAVCADLGVTYVDAGANLGFAGGVNTGLERVSPGLDVLLLNPDARVGPATVDLLHDRLLAADRVCAVAPTLVHPTSGARQRVTWPFPSPLRQWLIAAGLGRWMGRADFLVGSVLLLDRRALCEVGPFDERFFLYCEETDWQRRAAAVGWRTELVPDLVAEHVGGGTSDDSEVQQAYFHAAHELYVRKWFGRLGWASYRAACLAGDLLRSRVGGAAQRRAARRRAVIYRRGPVAHRDALLAGRR